jgi:hypothetical protein
MKMKCGDMYRLLQIEMGMWVSDKVQRETNTGVLPQIITDSEMRPDRSKCKNFRLDIVAAAAATLN